VTLTGIDPHRILEADLLRWLLLMGEALPELTQIAEKNLNPSHFRTPVGRLIYQKYLEAVKENKPRDLLSLATELETEEASQFFNEILQKKVNREKALPLFIETVQKILEREWMHQREAIQLKIYSGGCNEAEVLALARQFDILKKERPVVCT
jgi:DNA primase